MTCEPTAHTSLALAPHTLSSGSVVPLSSALQAPPAVAPGCEGVGLVGGNTVAGGGAAPVAGLIPTAVVLVDVTIGP
jgi:hypothetical protein